MCDTNDNATDYMIYEARTPLGVGVSRCPTHIGVRHLYDTRTTRVGKVKEVSEKSDKCPLKNGFFSLFRHSSNQWLTPKWHS